MVERGVTAAAMEVSSHALALGRVAGTSYDVAVFTNLSQDHLDFHAGMDDYFAAKAELVHARLRPGRGGQHRRRRGAASWPPRRRSRSPRSPRPGTGPPTGGPTDVRCGADGSTFRVIGPGGVSADASVALPGPFNVANALGAIVALVEAGVGLAAAVAGVAACPGVPGRLERVDAGQDFTVAGRLLAQARRGRGGAARAAPGHPGAACRSCWAAAATGTGPSAR